MTAGRIALASEHAGFALKESLKAYLTRQGFSIADCGAASPEPVDYPPIAEKLALGVLSGAFEKGVLICGTGIGMSIAANKVPGIRAALCADLLQARYTRLHNDANILCLGAWITGERLAQDIAYTFLTTGFEGGRHIPRLDMIADIEKAAGYRLTGIQS